MSLFFFFCPTDRPTFTRGTEGDGKRNILLGWPKCSHGKFKVSPVDRDEIQETRPKWWNISLYSVRDCHSFLDSGNFTNKANSHTPKVEIPTRPQFNMPFWRLCCWSEAILFKKFRPGHRAGVFIWENFHPSYRDLGRKN